MTTDLNDTALTEMAAGLREWATWESFTNEFRERCEATAALIDKHLAGASNEAEAALAIEAIFGDVGRAEARRLERIEGLHEATDDAFERGDMTAWKANFVQLLDYLSESHMEYLANHFATLADPQPVRVIDPAMLQPMPNGIQ